MAEQSVESKPVKSPIRVAKGASPVNGVIPPVEHRFKPGNDARRGKGDTAGAIVKNYINGFARRNLRTATIKRLRNDETKPHLMRVAAERVLLAMDEGADFDRILEHTDGRPKQTTEIKGEVFLRTTDDRAAEASAFAARLQHILRPARN